MRTATIKITFLVLIGTTANIGISFSAPSRIECLERLGNATTKAELDNCVKGTQSVNQKLSQVSTINSSSEEATCIELGFKKKTEPYANCVVELLERKQSVVEQNPNDPDDATCRKYGFKPKTNEYATCKQQIEQARMQASQQQAQYQQQQRQYQAQLDEQKWQREQAGWQQLYQLGRGISSGAYNANNAYGSAPTPPNPNRTYILPGGQSMTCRTTGSITNCF